MINSVKVKPCRTIDKVIESKDFKRVLNIIFVEIQKDIVVQAEIENFLIMQKSFDRLLSNKPLNKDELEIIKDFCNEALNKKSKIYQKIIKVLKRVEVHSFLDNFNCILLGHGLTNDIIKNKNINPIIISISKKADRLIAPEFPDDIDNIVDISINKELNIEELNKIINEFLEGDYQSILEIIRKAHDGVGEEKIYNYELFGKIIEGIIKNQDENKKKIEELKQRKDKDSLDKINLIFGFITNKNSDLDNKIANIYFKLIKKNS